MFGAMAFTAVIGCLLYTSRRGVVDEIEFHERGRTETVDEQQDVL